jgi:5-methylthioadenosine/S-adenosylhomocysteine deaminase
MATLGTAKALGLDHQLGSLTLDKKADVVLFDFRGAHLTPALNPLGTLVHVAQGRDINMVIVDGRVVVEHGEPVLVDAQRIREDGTAAARRLWNRISGHPLVAPVQQRS